jgi:hypothetical protein
MRWFAHIWKAVHGRRSALNTELELKCPKCGKRMEVLKPKGGTEPSSNLLRVCPFCATLAWNNADGSVEARTPRRGKP